MYARSEVIVASLLGLALSGLVWGPVLLRPFVLVPSELHAVHPTESPHVPPARRPVSLGRTPKKAKPTRVVDINRADALALQTLPGIGPALAARIVTYRKARGRFDEPAELLEIEGIGSRRFERLRPWVLAR